MFSIWGKATIIRKMRNDVPLPYGRVENPRTILLKEAATDIISRRRSTLINRHGGAAFTPNPLEWYPYHIVEGDVSREALKSVHHAVMRARIFPVAFAPSLRGRLNELKESDLAVMQITAGCLYPEFGDFYKANNSLVEREMQAAGVFDESEFTMVPRLITAAGSMEEHGGRFYLKPIDTNSPFAVQEGVFADTLNSFSRLADAMFLIPLLGIERLLDEVRAGRDPNAIETRNNLLPHSLSEVMEEGTRYNSDVLRYEFGRFEELFFGENTEDTPLLPTTHQALPHFKVNKQYYRNNILPLVQDQGRKIDLAKLLRDTATFVISQGSTSEAARLIKLQ